VVSSFSFKYPLNIESSDSGTNCGVRVDEDGDLIVCRKADKIQEEGIIAIGKVLCIDLICSKEMLIIIHDIKVKFSLCLKHTCRHTFLTSALHSSEWSASCSRYLTPCILCVGDWFECGGALRKIVLQKLMSFVWKGWPKDKSMMIQMFHVSFRDEITYAYDLLLKGNRCNRWMVSSSVVDEKDIEGNNTCK
jgi:hypothetical protein